LSHGGLSYAYDGLGNRVQQNALKYILDLQPSLAKVIGDSDGNSFIHAPRGIHAMEDNAGTWSYMAQDGLGSVRAEIDASAAVQQSVNYSEYGDPDTSLTGFAFTGEQRDTNGLQYHRARYYDPVLGIFPSLDPFEGVDVNAMSLNRYSYTWGNPISRTDASGMCPPATIENTRQAVRMMQASNPQFMSIDGATPDVVAAMVCSAVTAGQYLPQTVTVAGSTLRVGAIIAGTGAAATAAMTIAVVGTGILLGAAIYLSLQNPPVLYTPEQLDDMRPPTPTPEFTGTPEPTTQPDTQNQPQPQPQPIPAPAPAPEATRVNEPCHDDDCDLGLTPRDAAGLYATAAQAYWLFGKQVAGKNPPLVIALTRARTSTNECKGYLAINSPVGEIQHQTHKRNTYFLVANAINIFARASGNEVVWEQNPGQFSQGVHGHAERLLYNKVTSDGARMNAMGVSQKPCGNMGDENSCYSTFHPDNLPEPIVVSWWDRQTNLPAYYN